MDELALTLAQNRQLFGNARQALIYIHLLRSGPHGAEQLHKSTKLYRETVQRELKKMEKRGTIRFLTVGRNKKAEAISLSSLQESLENSKDSFERLLKPLLEVEAAKGDPAINVFINNHAFGLLQSRLIKLQPRHEDIYVISAQPKAWREAMTESRKMDLFEKTRLEKHVGFHLSCFSEYRGEVEHNNRQYFVSQPANLKRKYRYIETKDSSPLQIQVWFNTIVISMFAAAPSMHIVIEDARVRKAMKAYFDVLWSIGTS